jgi:hypothetical protein
MGDPRAWGLGEWVTTPRSKKQLVTKCYTEPLNWGHVARVGEMRYAYCILVGKPEGKNHSEDLDVDGRILLDRILEK